MQKRLIWSFFIFLGGFLSGLLTYYFAFKYISHNFLQIVALPRVLISLIDTDAERLICFQRGNEYIEITYLVSSSFPPDRLLNRLRSTLRCQGFKPLKADLLNPNIPSSHIRGWVKFFDPKHKQWVLQWIGQWQNEYNYIVGCSIRCLSDAPTPTDVVRFNVSISLLSPHYVSYLKSLIRRYGMHEAVNMR